MRPTKYVTPKTGFEEIGTSTVIADSFISMVSKNFARPLTDISGYCRDMLEQHGETLNKQCKEYLLKIYEETGKLNQCIDTLITSHHKTQNYMQTEMVDLGEMAKSIIDGLMWTKPERRVKFIAAINVIAECDAGLLKIVLKYLLGNSWKSTVHKEEALIEFGITELARETAYFVRHNGVGYDFFENDRPNEDGIDLDTIKKIIHEHNGKLWTEEKTGLEPTLFFTLQ